MEKRYTKRTTAGSGMVDYVVPALVIGTLVGVGIYSMHSSGVLKKFIVNTAGGKIEVITNHLSFGKGDYKPGLYVKGNGEYVLSTQSGKLIKVPEMYYDTIKNSILNSKSGNNEGVGVETSGAFGTDDQLTSESLTATYANILDDMAEQVEDPIAQKIINNLSIYAHKLGDVEGDLREIKATITKKKEDFETAKSDFYKSRDDFIAYFTNPNKDITQWQQKFETYRDSYFAYRDATIDYKDSSKKYVAAASAAFDDIKEETGIAYELLIFMAKASNKIPADAKPVTIGISEEVKDVKDKVLVTKEKVDFLKTLLDEQNNTLASEVNEYFDALKIEVDEHLSDNSNNSHNNNNNYNNSNNSNNGESTVEEVGVDTLASENTTDSTTTGESTTDTTETTGEESLTQDQMNEEVNNLVTMIVEGSDDSDDSITLEDTTNIESTTTDTTSTTTDSTTTTESSDTDPDLSNVNTEIDDSESDQIVDILQGMDTNSQDSVEDSVEDILDIIDVTDQVDNTDTTTTSTST